MYMCLGEKRKGRGAILTEKDYEGVAKATSPRLLLLADQRCWRLSSWLVLALALVVYMYQHLCTINASQGGGDMTVN